MKHTTFVIGLVTSLFLSPPAGAAVVYTDLIPDLRVKTYITWDEWGNWHEQGSPYQIDLNGDDNSEVTISHSHEPQAGGPPASSYWADPAAHVQLTVGEDSDAAKLTDGDEVGPSDNFGNWGLLYAELPGLGNWWGEGYLGIKFTIDSHTHYGWAHLTVSDGVTVHDFAYESIPSKAVRAGAVPEPSSVFLLLTGLMLGRSILPMCSSRRPTHR